jgi:hypothetical protein
MIRPMATSLSFLRLSAVFFLMIAVGCSTPTPDSAFDPDFDEGVPAVITSVVPADKSFAGFETVTLNGTDFGTDPAEVSVWFNNIKADVVSVTPTRIVVNTPNMVTDSIRIKVAKSNVVAFSNPVPYKLESLFIDATTLPTNTTALGAGIDLTGNLYVSTLASGIPSGVGKYSSSGVINATYVPIQGWAYRVVKVGPDGGLYMLRVAGGVPVVYRSGPAGGSTTNWGSGVGRAEDFDFDQNNFMWVVGANETNTVTNQSIVRVQDNGATRSYVRYPFVANGHSVKVYDGYLYVGGTRAGAPFIWRFPINPDNTLGAEETVVNLGTAYATDVIPRSIAFATDGTMFVSLSGTNFDQLPEGRQPLLAVSPSGDVSEYYPGVIPGIIVKMHWIPDTQRVLMTVLPRETGQTQRLISINFQKDGAPFYGIE